MQLSTAIPMGIVQNMDWTLDSWTLDTGQLDAGQLDWTV